MKPSALLFLGFALFAQSVSIDYFVPSQRIEGIGVARVDIGSDALEERTERMIQTQTFSIMREPEAAAGARRVTGDSKLQRLFRSAAEHSGFPQPLLEAIAYLESFGEADARSPAGPTGIMQISEGTAQMMGLTVRHSTRYRRVRERVLIRSKRKKPRYRNVTRKIPYSVISRDDRLYPERAIPAAADYLAGMEAKFGGRDWAIFAYHCGQGCVAKMMELSRQARGIPEDQLSVARMFFSANPAWNRELYEAVEQQIGRDWSPTYWFRVMRAQQLLALYRSSPREFETLARQYKSDFGDLRAPFRLAVWLKRSDLVFHTAGDLRSDLGRSLLVRAFNQPDYFGYSLDLLAASPADLKDYAQASPSAVGALIYVAYETRRLYAATDPFGKFEPLDVISLVTPADYARLLTNPEALAHVSGQVFDINYAKLPPRELECLRFVLDDLGWGGYLGFVEEGDKTLHIGCAPEARDFFAGIYAEAANHGPTS